VTSAERAWLWPSARRVEAAAALARAAGLARAAAPAWFRVDDADFSTAAGARGSSARLRAFAPAFFHVYLDAQPEVLPPNAAPPPELLLVIVAWTASGAKVLTPEGATVDADDATVTRLLRAGAEGRVGRGVDRVVARAALAGPRARAVREALVGAALEGEPVTQGWRLAAPSTTFGAALRAAGLPRRLALAAFAYAGQLALLVGAWWLIGARATGGAATSTFGWLGVLAAFVAVHFAASWAAGRLAVDAGHVLRDRLMEGLLRLDTEPLRAEGIGQLLGRVMEIESVESLALGGGLLAVAGLFELVSATVVLALGARVPVTLACLAAALLVGAALAARLARALARWSDLRRGLTHDLVERMVGHRTLVAQQPPELRHREEDRALAQYEGAGRALDRAGAALAVLVPRGFLLAGVAALAPALADGPGVSPELLAASLGGVLFAYGALRKLALAFPSLATATVAWRQVAPLFAATGADVSEPASEPSGPPPPASATPPLLAARDVRFGYPGRARPAIDACSFEIRRGDRVLLEGPSGGGKSTLASLIAGLRAPDAGELALDGVGQPSLGLTRWRERVGVVPQFHENHVFSATVLFNLLMGRSWPPRREDIVEAEALCRELDLSGLLARMPSGLEQLVGESGWQLSHGERSRLFIARALLQRLDVRVLDESFAALDPQTLERVLGCVLGRAETLVVIAHP
jgi:ATP-binding cassette subfamily B protein